MRRLPTVLYLTLTAARNPLLPALAARLHGSRVEYVMATFGPAGPIDEQLEPLGVPVHHLDVEGMTGMPGAVASVRRLLRDVRPDVVHVNLFLPGAVIELARRTPGAGRPPSVLTRHHDTSHHLQRKPLHVAVDRWTARAATLVHAPSTAVARTLVDREGVPEEKVRVLHHGVDWDALDVVAGSDAVARWRAELGPGPWAAAVTRLEDIKRVEDAIVSVARARRVVPDLRLAIAGTGPHEATLRAASHALPRDAVRFLGQVEDAAALMAAVDVVVATSEAESFGLTVVEAMGLGVPVVATTPGGVKDTTAGVLPPIAPRDVVALADGLVAIVRDPDAARRAAGARASDVRERFGADAMAAGTAALYDEVRTVGSS